MYAKKNSGKKLTVLLLALVLLIGCTIGGTLAWLMDTSNTVTNTFTVGDIAIELKEHTLVNGTLSNTEATANVEDTYKIVPGTEQPKDPFVRFTENSEACWLFVKIEEENNTVANKNYKYVTYNVDSAWTPLTGETGVYYMDLTSAGITAGTVKNILADKKVTYDESLTKEELAAAATANPQLIFTAYAVQKEAAETAATAWALVKNNPAN